MSAVRIRLLGGFELEFENQRTQRFPSRKARDLFAYLVLHRNSLHSREQLAGLFWGDVDDEHARRSLNTALWRARQMLPALHQDAAAQHVLRVTPREIGINNASKVWIDAAEFESRCALAEQSADREQQIALYAQAVSFYQGDLLPDCYEDWCIVERERLQYRYLGALSRLVRHHSAAGDHQLAIGYANRILACDPLREEVHRDLIRFHLAAGQTAAAVRQYRACEEVLRSELGTEPLPETRQILAAALAAPARAEPKPIAAAKPTRSGISAQQLLELAELCEQTRARLVEAARLLDRASSKPANRVRDAKDIPLGIRFAVGS